MEASIVVIAFQKEIVKMVKVKVEVEIFDFITNPILLTSAVKGEGAKSAPTQSEQMHQETIDKNANDNESYILICIYGIKCDFMPKSCSKHSNFDNFAI